MSSGQHRPACAGRCWIHVQYHHVQCHHELQATAVASFVEGMQTPTGPMRATRIAQFAPERMPISWARESAGTLLGGIAFLRKPLPRQRAGTMHPGLHRRKFQSKLITDLMEGQAIDIPHQENLPIVRW
jgi:hypothetical protein